MKLIYVEGKKSTGEFITSILLPLLVGVLAALLIRGASSYYNGLSLPPFSPPAILFPIVWTILYVFMGFASYRVKMKNPDPKAKCHLYYAIQLLLNFLWSIIFFRLKSNFIAFIDIVLLLIFVIATYVEFRKADKIASRLLIPYIIWVVYAMYINFSLI